jgi:CO/xanthine dehydrogenase Mo-binding subunit
MTDLLNEKRFTRPTFLKGTGALVVGFSLGGSALAGKAQAAGTRGDVAGPPDATQVDTWLALHEDNTATLYLGKVEIGQGNTTGLIQVAAEELDMDMSQFRLVRHDTNVTPNQGNTSGSASIRSGGPQVRSASAEARQALLGLAAAKLGVSASSLTVSKGVVSGGGQSVKYGDLLGGKLFNVKQTGKAPTKPVSSYKVVGTTPPRIDIPDKVTGKYTYVQNVRTPGMLHGRVVRPKGQAAWGTGAKVLSVDKSSIKNIPGAQVVQVGDFLGVVAPHEYGAVQAAAQLKVKWVDQAKLPGNGNLFSKMRAETTKDTVRVNTGNLDAGFKAGTKVLQQRYDYGYQIHGSLGPMAAIADVKPTSATVLCSSQNCYGVRASLAPTLGLPETSIRVQYFEGSGVYGGNQQNDVAHAAAIMSKAVGKPVRVQLMRWDEHGWDNNGPAHTADVRAAVDAKGNIVAYDYTGWMIPYFTLDTTPELQGQKIPDPTAGFTGGGYIETANVGGQYALKNARVTTKAVPVFEGYFKTTFLRAPSAPQAVFASEQMMDELAHAAGMDPVAFRLQNITDDHWSMPLTAARNLANWQPKVANSTQQSGNVVTGRGVAIGGFAGSAAAVVADIEVNKKTGKITAKHLFAALDVGLAVNPALVQNQMEGSLIQGVSRALLEEVKFTKTRITSNDWSTYPILRFKDVPTVTTTVVQRMDKPSSGAGEPALAPVAAAIANAFFDATGKRIRTAPMTPARVRAALTASA